MPDFQIASVVILEPQEEVIAAQIAAARPDLEVRFGLDASVPEGPFALAAFDPKISLSRFRDAAWVHCNGAGVDKLCRVMDFTPPVMTRTVGLMGEQMAEYVLAYVLAEAQKMPQRAACQAERKWAKQEMLPTFLWGKRAVIFGTGQIAQIIAARLQAFGIACDGVSRSGRPAASFDRVASLEQLDRLNPSGIDIAVLALPNLADTKGLIGSSILSQFDGVQLINVGRGEVLDIPSLLMALEANQVRQAVLDVFPEEPLAKASPLWSHPQIVVTPHVSGVTRPEDAAAAFLTALDALEQGKSPPHPVDPASGY